MDTKTLDAKGMACPLPVLRANKMIKTLQPGDELQILATDTAAPQDFVNYCAQTGHVLVDSRESEPGTFVIVIRKVA